MLYNTCTYLNLRDEGSRAYFFEYQRCLSHSVTFKARKIDEPSCFLLVDCKRFFKTQALLFSTERNSVRIATTRCCRCELFPFSSSWVKGTQVFTIKDRLILKEGT